MKKFLILTYLLALSISANPYTSLATTDPELPRAYVDTNISTPNGKTIEVKSGGNLQEAIDGAEYGDEIVLESGAEFIGSFILKRKNSGSGWITIRSSEVKVIPGVRVNPILHAGAMAKIKSPGSNLPALSAESGASGYRIIGIEFAKKSPEAVVTNLILLGNGSETSVNTLPRNIILDRIYAHGDSTSNLRRCVGFNGVSMAIIDSYISDCHEKGADSQAVAGWNGPGPFKIVNNYLEAASENVMFGGADPKIDNLVPSDIEIRKNHFYKPLSWKGKGWVVKNLFETKNARRVLVEDNVFENSWTEGQTGTAILIKSANQDGKCAWCVSSDITFKNNVVKNANEGLRINAAEGSPLPQKVARVKFENTTFENIAFKLFQIFGGASDISFVNVQAHSPESILFGDNGSGLTNPGLVIKNSILERGRYGIGAGSEEGNIYLNKWFSGFTFENNILINSSGGVSNEKLASFYPAGTRVVSTKAEALALIGAVVPAPEPEPVSNEPELTAPTPTEPEEPISSPAESTTSPTSSPSSRSQPKGTLNNNSKRLEESSPLEFIPVVALYESPTSTQKLQVIEGNNNIAPEPSKVATTTLATSSVEPGTVGFQSTLTLEEMEGDEKFLSESREETGGGPLSRFLEWLSGVASQLALAINAFFTLDYLEDNA